jgi:hypothetical protein
LVLIAGASVSHARTFRLAYKLSPGTTFGSTDQFGVSLAAAGRDLLIAPQPQEYAPGEAFLFDGRTGALRRMLSGPTPSPADWFGTSVAATDRLLVVAASGAVHVLDNAGNFLRTFSLDPALRFFLPRVAVLGDKVLVGDVPEPVGEFNKPVLLLDVATGAVVQTFDPPESNPHRFGEVLALAPNLAIVGAPGLDRPGKVYAFDTRSGALVWSREAPDDRFGDSQFGYALAADGSRLLVGAPGNHPLEFGNVYLLDASTGSVQRRYHARRRGSGFGISVAIRNDRVLVGAPAGHRGVVYLLARKTGKLIATFLDNPHDESEGTGVTVALAGRRIVVSEPFDLAAVRVFVH